MKNGENTGDVDGNGVGKGNNTAPQSEDGIDCSVNEVTKLMGEQGALDEPVKKKRGNPAFFKGMKPLNPAGKPKGARTKHVLLRERLEQIKYDPLAQYIAIVRKPYISKEEERKAMLLWKLIDKAHPTEKVSENHNTNDNTLTITMAYNPLDQQQLLEAQAEFGGPAITAQFTEVMPDGLAVDDSLAVHATTKPRQKGKEGP